MSLTMTIVMMIGAWLFIAAAMLWGVLRVARRHQSKKRVADTTEPKVDGHGPASVN